MNGVVVRRGFTVLLTGWSEGSFLIRRWLVIWLQNGGSNNELVGTKFSDKKITSHWLQRGGPNGDLVILTG